MSVPFNEIEFKRNAVRPVECIKLGWELIRSQYWLFVGISVVGMIIASLVPMGILLGPMMCGIHLSLLKQRRGQFVEFGDLFKGFDYFGDSLIAAMLHIVPAFIIIIPTYIIFYISLIALIAGSGGRFDFGVFLGFFGFWGIILLVLLVIMILISIAFTFAYPLIVDRRIPGFDAVKLSMKAAMANFWGLLGLMLLTTLLGFAGVVVCYVGAILVMPISFAAIATAYEHVFGLGDGKPKVPPPPPSFT